MAPGSGSQELGSGDENEWVKSKSEALVDEALGWHHLPGM